VVAQVRSPNKNAFHLPVKIQLGERALQTNGLLDTGAQIRLSISPKFARTAIESLGARLQKIKTPIQLTDYRKRATEKATHELVASFEIDGIRFSKEKFLIIETGFDIFIGQEWFIEKDVWLHPRTKTIRWPDKLMAQRTARFSPPIVVDKIARRIDKAAQEDVERRDKLMEEDDRQTKKYTILQNPDRQINAVVPDETKTVSVAKLMASVISDPRQERWKKLKMPKEPIPFKDVDYLTVSLNAVTTNPIWKTYDGKPIPFPDDEDPEHVKRVRELLPQPLAHLEGFFSKIASTKLPPSQPGRDVVLELARPLEGSPPSFRTPLSLLPLEKETTDELLRIGFIEPCMDANAASVLFVNKGQTNEKRFCADYRWVNTFLVPRLVKPPDVSGTIANCRNAKRMTKIDIIRAFNRMLIHADSRYLSAFRTRQGTFRWKVLPFGFQVGPAWWQAFINAQLNELLDFFASAYADDVLIYTDKDDDNIHYEQVEEVIYRLHKADLQGDIKKSRFNVTTVEYLGIVIEAGKGVRIDPVKIEAIAAWKIEDMRSASAVRSFLGLCNFIHMWCHHASGTAEPLTRLLKKDVKFEIGSEQIKAFEEMKKLATTAPVLAFFVPGRPTKVETDASRNATGGVIWQQQEDQTWKPVGYFSKTMTPAERAYPIQDRELLAVVQTLEKYEPELLGTKFFVVTDHQALIYWSSKRLLSTRQVRWSDFLANFDITFQYRRGKENVVADALSRKTVDTPTVKHREREDRTFALIPPETIDPTTPIAAVETEAIAPKGADLVDLIIKENKTQKLGKHDTRLIVPETTSDGKIYLRTALIAEAHLPQIFAHGGENKTLHRLKRNYFWEGMTKDIKRYIRNCRACKWNNTRRDKTPGLLHPLPIPNRVWEQVVVDGKDMPKDEYGYDYVWAFICKFSRLMATLPGKKNDTAEKVAARYYRHLYRFLGLPNVWISDNAGPFVSGFLETINTLTGTKHRHGSSLHPQTQGAVEITNAELDQRLRFYIDKYQTQWSKHLPALDFSHNTSYHSSIGMAPLKVALGSDPRDPLSLPLEQAQITDKNQKAALDLIEQTKAVQDLARENALKAQIAQEKQANKKRRPVDFGVGDMVYVNKKGFTTEAPTTRLDSANAGPWLILGRKGHSYVLETPSWFKGSSVFHADRLRKAADDPLPQQHVEQEEPEEIDGEPEWEVDEVLASRINGRNKALEYQVSWRGCDPDETWYKAENFKNSATALETFHNKYPDCAGPPKRLQQWIRAAANDESAGHHVDDNTAEHAATGLRARKKHPTRHK
jgi:hypothetical protein